MFERDQRGGREGKREREREIRTRARTRTCTRTRTCKHGYVQAPALEFVQPDPLHGFEAANYPGLAETSLVDTDRQTRSQTRTDPQDSLPLL